MPKDKQNGPDPGYKDYLNETSVRNILSKFNGREVVKQYAEHQPFLLTGLDSKEEFKSRMAFVDAYKDELAEIHAEIKSHFTQTGDKNEFDYLKYDDFRKAAGLSTDIKSNQFIVEMMKDYMTYQHILGKVSTANYNSFLEKETDPEKEFRKQNLLKDEKNFLIEESAFSEDKKKGIRECRKWMYRNCGKSGFFNETGSKRNYIDSFAKRSVAVQVNTLYQIEKGLYKYDNPAGYQEKNSLSEDYKPSLTKLKDKLNRKKKNPYNLYKKAVGDFFYWSRLERALKKSDAREKVIGLQYKAVTLEGKINASAEDKKGEDKERKEINNPVSVVREMNRVKKASKVFNDAKKKYKDCLKKYMKKRSRNTYMELLEQGNKIQRLVKSSEYSDALAMIDKADKKKAIASFAEFTVDMRYVNRMDDKSIEKIMNEKVQDGVDIGLTVKGLGDKVYSAGSGLAEIISGGKQLAKVTRGFGFGTAISSAYTSIKCAVMSVVSWKRKNKAEEIQKLNKLNMKAQAKKKAAAGNNAQAEKGLDIDSRRINDIAKVSKKRNSLKAKGYATEACFAASAVGFTVLGIVGIVALPLTIAGGIVGGAGFGIKYAMDYYARKKVASKAIDSMMKTEEFEKNQGKAPEAKQDEGRQQEHKRYIDEKVDERKKLMEDKKWRFAVGQRSRNILNEYMEEPDKIKNRVRENWAVSKGNISIYSFSESQDRENVMEAYRHMFLKDPEGPINYQNFIPPSQVKVYMSTNKNDLKNTKQTEEQARKRALYRELLKSEGIETKAPSNMEEARKLFTAKKSEVKKDKPKERAL